MGFLLESPVQLADSQVPYLSIPRGALQVTDRHLWLPRQYCPFALSRRSARPHCSQDRRPAAWDNSAPKRNARRSEALQHPRPDLEIVGEEFALFSFHSPHGLLSQARLEGAKTRQPRPRVIVQTSVHPFNADPRLAKVFRIARLSEVRTREKHEGERPRDRPKTPGPPTSVCG
jgi:hypothetical protein